MSAPRQRPLGILVMWASPIAVALVTGYLVVQAFTVDPMGCTDPKQKYLPDFSLLVAAGAAVLIGRLLGNVRHQEEWEGWEQQRGTQVAGGLALCILLAAAAAALVYESIGVVFATNYGVAAVEPITYYIRCAVYNDKLGHGDVAIASYVVLIISGLIIGNWLWSAGPADHSN